MFGRKMVVAQHRPWTTFLQVVVAVAVLVLATLAAYIYGRTAISIEASAAKESRDQLAQEVEGLSAETVALRERIAVLERAAQIDRQAYDEVDQYVVELQSEIYSLREEVGFYRGIVSEQEARGLQIQSFEVKSAQNGGNYRYLLVLTQDMKNDKVISGTVKVSVLGEKSGEVVSLSGEAIREVNSRDSEFQFKHFQRIEGSFALPSGFKPRSVSIEVVDADAKKTIAEKQFDWRWPIG